MTPFNISDVEAVMKLMKKYGIDEYASEYFSLKMTQHPVKKARKPYTRKVDKEKQKHEQDQEFLDNHTVPPTLEDEPWNNIDQSLVDRFTINGKLG